MEWAERVVRIRAIATCIEHSEKRSFGRRRRDWDDNIKTELGERRSTVSCFRLIRNRIQWLAVIHTVETFSVVVSSCLSVRPFFHMEQLGSHWTDFCKILFLSIFPKSLQKTQVSLKLTNVTGTLRESVSTFMTISG